MKKKKIPHTGGQSTSELLQIKSSMPKNLFGMQLMAQTDKQTNKQTDIAANRLNHKRGLYSEEGQFS